jgi:type I restriction enzyme S subunit
MSWKEVKISDFAKVVTGGTPSTQNPAYWDGGTIPWLPSGACQNCRITSADTFITELGLKESAAKMMPPNTVVIALTGATTGKVGLLEIEACANQSVTGILPNDKFVPEYLFHYLMSIREKILFDSYGGAQKHISQAYVKELKILLPDIETQKSIAKALEQIHTLIAKRKEQINVLDKLANDTFFHMFGDPVMNPMNWDTTQMGKLGEFKNGMNYAQDDKGYCIKCLGVGDFKSLYEISDINNLSEIHLSQEPSESYLLKDNDIVFVRSNGNKALVGRSVVVYPNGAKVTFSGFCIRFRNNSDEIIPKYLNYALHTPSLKSALLQKTRGANIQNLNQQMLSSLEIPLPPIELQKEFADKIDYVNQQSSRLQASLIELETIYKSTLQKAFSGELFQ